MAAPIFCFIDDSQFELNVFAENIAANIQDIDFVFGSNYEDVRNKLGDRYPCLFLLDLYGRDSDVEHRIPSFKELENEVKSIRTLESVYNGLESFSGDITNEYLKRLFDLTDGWRQLFFKASRTAGQNINYGLNNYESARRDYPAAAMIAYTRKSLITDAVEVLHAGMDGVTLKPGGASDKDIGEATAASAENLIEAWSAFVTNRFNIYIKDLIILLIRSGLDSDLPNLAHPDKLSDAAQALLGPGDMKFVQEAAVWWSYTGRSPVG